MKKQVGHKESVVTEGQVDPGVSSERGWDWGLRHNVIGSFIEVKKQISESEGVYFRSNYKVRVLQI